MIGSEHHDGVIRNACSIERAEQMLDHKFMTGPYPRLTLSEGERFASKGGYLVRFAGTDGKQVIADQDWTIPN